MYPIIEKIFLFMIAACVSTAAIPEETTQITYPDIVRRIYDMEMLALHPVHGERTALESSHDRNARYNPATQRYENWGANNDGQGFVRKEGDAIVAADLEGPGVIWRIWTARAQQGHIQVFIDGNVQPVIDRPFADLFDSKKAPFTYNQLVREMARGLNFFVPIVYQKSCKILLQPKWGSYFQITYTRFPKGTQLDSFNGTFSAEESAALERAQAAIGARGMISENADAQTTQRTITLNPNETLTVWNGDTPGAITALRVKPQAYATEKQAEIALRSLALSIYWDGETSPSVWAPLSDFFGSGYGANPYKTLVSGLDKEGFYTRWYMPYASAKLDITNDGDTPQTLLIQITQAPLKTDSENLLRFHAKWHRNDFGDHEPARYFDDRWPDWPFLLAGNTAGRFCGLSLHLWNPFHLWNKQLRAKYIAAEPPTKQELPAAFLNGIMTHWWWGEGDEKFFVDGEKFPSSFGTGTEDYFGYAWGAPRFFDSHTQAQPRNNDNTGHIVVNRWHLSDNVPFDSSFEGTLEKYHGDNWPLLYAATAFWYQSPHTSDRYAPRPISERIDYFDVPAQNPQWVQGDGRDSRDTKKQANAVWVEAESLTPTQASDGIVFSTQDMRP